MPNWLVLVVVGVVCIVVHEVWKRQTPSTEPPIVAVLLQIVGYIALVVGVILFVVQLLGLR